MIPTVSSSFRALVFMGATAMLFAEAMATKYGIKPVDSSTLDKNKVTILNSAPHLDVWIYQTEIHPPTIRVEITNDNDHTITFSTWNSPLDPEAIQKKILKTKRKYVWPVTDLPIYGLRPNFTSPCEVHKKEKAEDLVELRPGLALQQDHVFNKESGWDLSKRHRAGRLRKSAVQMIGMWCGVWNMTKEEVLELPARDDEYSQCHWFTSNIIIPRL